MTDTLTCKFKIGQKVHIDSDTSIVGVISCVEWRSPAYIRYEVSWVHNGDAKFIVFEEWRLSPI